ncbi:MAG TPA: M20 family metallopeptidase [Candidatus Methylomirabilis sp.]|nr:M20 family metallopeptidase [Candidatus Methylomirabilis sp.]
MAESSAASLLRLLVGVPSINPRERVEPAEEAMAKVVAEWLAGAGVEAELQTVLPGRPNVLARVPGRDRTRTFLLESHMDTVEVTGMQVDPFAGEIRDGRLYGRGACDAKGPLAAMLLAVAELARGERPPVDVLLAAVMDEEHRYRGVSALLQRVEPWAAAIVGEPTELELVVAHKGCVRFPVTAHGRACHSSMPWDGDNAIMRMADLLLFIREELEPEVAAKIHPRVGPATLCVSLIGGGSSVNTVPATCTIQIDRRTIPGEEPLATWTEYRDRLQAFAPGHVTVGEPSILDYALDTDPAEAVVRTLASAVGEAGYPAAIRGVNYGTDASKLARAGIPSVVFGPGSIRQAHGDEEYIELSQLEAAVSILVRAVRAYA